jgi:hypothetical protein
MSHYRLRGGPATVMLYQDAFLQRLETGLRATLPKWGLPETAPVSLLTISENATYLVQDEANGSCPW